MAVSAYARRQNAVPSVCDFELEPYYFYKETLTVCLIICFEIIHFIHNGITKKLLPIENFPKRNHKHITASKFQTIVSTGTCTYDVEFLAVFLDFFFQISCAAIFKTLRLEKTNVRDICLLFFFIKKLFLGWTGVTSI